MATHVCLGHFGDELAQAAGGSVVLGLLITWSLELLALLAFQPLDSFDLTMLIWVGFVGLVGTSWEIHIIPLNRRVLAHRQGVPLRGLESVDVGVPTALKPTVLQRCRAVRCVHGILVLLKLLLHGVATYTDMALGYGAHVSSASTSMVARIARVLILKRVVEVVVVCSLSDSFGNSCANRDTIGVEILPLMVLLLMLDALVDKCSGSLCWPRLNRLAISLSAVNIVIVNTAVQQILIAIFQPGLLELILMTLELA